MEGSWFARPSSPQTPGLAAALVPVATLVGLLGLSFVLFGDAAAARGVKHMTLVGWTLTFHVFVMDVAPRSGRSSPQCRPDGSTAPRRCPSAGSTRRLASTGSSASPG